MVFAGVVSLIAVAVTGASLAWLHVQPTRLSAVHDAVGEYGITPFRSGYRVAAIAFGVAGVALAIGIDRAIARHGHAGVVALLVVFGVARAAISWFPMDAPDTPRTSTGAIHVLLAFVTFLSITGAAIWLGAILPNVTRWHSLGPASTVLGYAMAACLAIFGWSRLIPALRTRFGATERGFYVLALTWTALFAFACAANLH
ncbi:MAG TPA: DUF998 domain-containing protein [Solirubrobacteraceae bacterium]|nr:DUF998 domain-containing protein [Solirubrobacteraceae bacterium]